MKSQANNKLRQNQKNKKQRRILFLYNYHKKKTSLFLKRNLINFTERRFGKIIIFRLKSNNIFCTFNDVGTKKTLFSCFASRYNVKITAKRLKYQILRIATFFYHEIKRKIKAEGIIIKIIAPKFLKRKIFNWCKYNLSRFRYKQKYHYRNMFVQIKDNKSYNGCRVKKKEEKKEEKIIIIKNFKYFIMLIFLLKILFVIIPLLISVAYFTLAERKILGAIQRRKGPNVVGLYGLLQPLSDGFKLLIKETIIPSSANNFIFIMSPMFTFLISLMGWAVIPYSKYSLLVELNLGLLYILAISSLGVYGIILSGWSSNSKYAFLGALRSTAQMISYEVSIGFIIVTVVITCGTFNLNEIIVFQNQVWFVIPFLPLSFLFFISALAETNRHPFDLPEAEAELVSGYNVEYSAMGFALFSLGEYANMLLMCSLNVILFFGGWLPFILDFSYNTAGIWFGLKICFFVILFVWIRAALPRYRYDQLMGLGWKVILPISLCYFMLTVSILTVFNMYPH